MNISRQTEFSSMARQHLARPDAAVETEEKIPIHDPLLDGV